MFLPVADRIGRLEANQPWTRNHDSRDRQGIPCRTQREASNRLHERNKQGTTAGARRPRFHTQSRVIGTGRWAAPQVLPLPLFLLTVLDFGLWHLFITDQQMYELIRFHKWQHHGRLISAIHFPNLPFLWAMHFLNHKLRNTFSVGLGGSLSSPK